MTYEAAKKIFGKHCLGPDELNASGRFSFTVVRAPDVPFADDVLERCAETHILLFAPETFTDDMPVTLNALRDLFGTDPATSEPCMYNQDWYAMEDFAAKTTPDNKWHLLRKDVVEEARAKRPDDIEADMSETEQLPSAVICALAFFGYWFATGGERLWNHDFIWCSDRDHNNDRIYVGRYEDPTGVNKNGFNIHRHLALRPSYSVAPEMKR